MAGFIKENWKILQNAVGKEPPFHILKNAARKIVGLKPLVFYQNSTPQHDANSHSSPHLHYQLYLSKRHKYFERRSSSTPSIKSSLIWIVNSGNIDLLLRAKKSIQNQTIPFSQFFLVCRDDDLRNNLKTSESFSSIKDAIQSVNTDYVCMLHNESCLSKYYLQELAYNLSKNQEVDVLYACEDEITKDGVRENPQFKPKLNPDLLYGYNYIGSNLIISKKFGTRLGWFNEDDYPNGFMYEFLLRALNNNASIQRHNDVLISQNNSENESIQEKKKALSKHIKEKNWDAKVEEGIVKGTFYINRVLKETPLVSIIIPFKDKVGLLKNCVESILIKTTYENFEIILADNGSAEQETAIYIADVVKNNENIHHQLIDIPFNFSAINNRAVEKCKGEYLLFLNNDTEVISTSWLTHMMKQIQMPDIGVVGAKLIYEENTIQHAGIIYGIGHVAGHPFRNFKENDEKHEKRINLTQEYLSVTGACLLTKRHIFQDLNGFDEENLAIAYNDVDYCLSVGKSGYKVLYSPLAKLYHFESKSRPNDLSVKEKNRYEKECTFMRNKWNDLYINDSYYHPHLDRRYEDFEKIL